MRHVEINEKWASMQPFVGKPNDISMEEVGLTQDNRRISTNPPNKYVIDEYGQIKGIHDPEKDKPK